MLFIHTWEKILSGEKTQTRRIIKPEHTRGKIAAGTPLEFIPVGQGWGSIVAVRSNGRDVYAINKTYAVCPGRGKKQIARIRIVEIRQEDVRQISDGDLKAEGFESKSEFLTLWEKMHGSNYDAWVLCFELVK